MGGSEPGKRALKSSASKPRRARYAIESASPRCSVELGQSRRPPAHGIVQDRRDIDGVLGHDVLQCRSRRLPIHAPSREFTLYARRCGAASGQPSPRELAGVGAIVEQADMTRRRMADRLLPMDVLAEQAADEAQPSCGSAARASEVHPHRHRRGVCGRPRHLRVGLMGVALLAVRSRSYHLRPVYAAMKGGRTVAIHTRQGVGPAHTHSFPSGPEPSRQRVTCAA